MKTPRLAQVRSGSFTAAALAVSGFLRAVAVHSFVNPNNFAPGGVAGLATILTYLTQVNSGVYLFAVNLPLLVIAFIFVGRPFAVKTSVSIVLSSAFLLLFEQVDFFVYTDNAILAAIAGGLLNGVGVALLFRLGGASGGTDIIATIIHDRLRSAGVSWFIFGLDSIVVVASFFVYDFRLTPVLLAFVDMFCSARICDNILSGFKSAVKFEVITPHPQALSDELIGTLHRGVTAVPAVGMYAFSERALLICVVRRRQIGQFQRVFKKYPDTFAYISNASEVMGQFKK